MRKLIVISGIPIDDLNVTETLDRLDDFIIIGREQGRSHQVATVNADFVVKAMSDPELRYLLQDADLSMPDGMPLVWGARLLGLPLEERVAGSDIIPMLAERAAEKGYSIYFLGAAPGVAQIAADTLKEKHPDLKIAGIHSPPFSSVLDMGPEIVEDIKNAKPDILLVAFGNPKQEKWIGMYRHQINVPVMIGVGATLDFIAGHRVRAPLWMQKSGLEWLFRVLQEPRRLWRRYTSDLLNFGYFFIRQWWIMRRGNPPILVLPSAEIAIVDNKAAVIDLQGKITVENHEKVFQKGLEALDEVGVVILEMGDVSFLDSTAVGTLVALTKEARIRNGELILVNVPEQIQKTINTLKLTSFFLTMPSVNSALKSVNDEPKIFRDRQKQGLDGTYKEEFDSIWTIVPVPRRLDGLTADLLLKQCEKCIKQNPFLILDFTATVFLASAGIAALARIQKFAKEENGQLRVANCSDEVKRVIEIVRFDKILSVYKDIATAKSQVTSA